MNKSRVETSEIKELLSDLPSRSMSHSETYLIEQGIVLILTSSISVRNYSIEPNQ